MTVSVSIYGSIDASLFPFHSYFVLILFLRRGWYIPNDWFKLFSPLSFRTRQKLLPNPAVAIEVAQRSATAAVIPWHLHKCCHQRHKHVIPFFIAQPCSLNSAQSRCHFGKFFTQNSVRVKNNRIVIQIVEPHQDITLSCAQYRNNQIVSLELFFGLMLKDHLHVMRHCLQNINPSDPKVCRQAYFEHRQTNWNGFAVSHYRLRTYKFVQRSVLSLHDVLLFVRVLFIIRQVWCLSIIRPFISVIRSVPSLELVGY